MNGNGFNNSQFDSEKIGSRCSEEHCCIRDFLPFRCIQCQKLYCKSHRNSIDHSCLPNQSGHSTAGSDMTSMECPICGVGIKFDKNVLLQDPNNKERDQHINYIWEQHYINDCKKINTKLTEGGAKKRCGRLQGCNTILGPSNTFTCNLCHTAVCLTHRIPEEHNCKDILLKNRLNNNSLLSIDKKKNTTTINENNKKPLESNNNLNNNNMNKKNNTNKTVDEGNTLKGSADRRKKNIDSTISSTSSTNLSYNNNNTLNNGIILTCPFCDFKDINSQILERHVNNVHSDIFSNNSNKTSISRPDNENNTRQTTEECPVCKERFPDAISLVSHFETHHNNNSNNNNNNNNNNNHSNNNKKDCQLS